MHKLLIMVAMAAVSLLVVATVSAGGSGATSTRTPFATTLVNFCSFTPPPPPAVDDFIDVTGTGHIVTTQLGDGLYLRRLNFQGI